jgi:hypothetical protein
MYLKELLTTLKMKENESMIKHIHTFRGLLDQLLAARSLLSDKDSVLALMSTVPQSYKTSLMSI